MPVVWDDTLKDRVRALWPTHSSREIAKTISTPEFFVSRQSISALAARIGLTGKDKTRDTTAANPFGMLSDGRVKKPALEEPLISRFYADDVSEFNIRGMYDLERHHCRFIISADLTEPISCGRAVVRGSWCEHHRRIVFEPREVVS
jgi:hypothetical protein